MTPRQQRDQVIADIAEAIERGDMDRATIIRKANRVILGITFAPEPDPSRLAASPINHPFENISL